MSLQRRLLVYMLLCAPLVWAVAMLASANRARVEVNELFDTEIIHLARQVQATLAGLKTPGPVLPVTALNTEDGDVRDLALAVWDAKGELLLVDREGVLLPLLVAMNGLFTRVGATLARERRFTADAAHELRTPLAVLRAQWDLQRNARTEAERREAEAKLGQGLDRMDRLVSQMLALSRVDANEGVAHTQAVDWHALVEQAMSDVLPLAERRWIELGCDWPPAGTAPFPVHGDAALLAVLLRNLLDNAVRYAPEGSAVSLRFSGCGLEVVNAGPALTPDALAMLGERFHRSEGQAETGSGLGVSIARRVAELHGLQLRHRAKDDGLGVVAALSPATPKFSAL